MHTLQTFRQKNEGGSAFLTFPPYYNISGNKNQLIVSNLSIQIISNFFTLFSETNDGHSFCNEQRF